MKTKVAVDPKLLTDWWPGMMQVPLFMFVIPIVLLLALMDQAARLI